MNSGHRGFDPGLCQRYPVVDLILEQLDVHHVLGTRSQGHHRRSRRSAQPSRHRVSLGGSSGFVSMHGRSLNAENGHRSGLIVSGRLEFICGPERMSHRVWVASCKTLSPEFAQAAITS